MKSKWSLLIPALSILATLAIGATVHRSATLTNFNAGEVSPLLQARVDFPKHRAGAKTLQNMLVRSQGPATRRPGTKWVATVKDSGDPVRLIPFEYSTEDAYVIELGDDYARFYRNGAPVLSEAGAYEIATPWDANDLFEIQYTQDAQMMRLVHPDYAPYKLTRASASHTDWTCTAIAFERGPFLDENETESSTITPSATTGDVNLVATGGLFQSGHVGALWQVSHIVDSNEISGLWWGSTISGDALVMDRDGDYFDANSNTLTIYEDQEYTVTTGGDWTATLKIQRSYDDGASWNTVKSFTYRANGNVLYSGIEEEDDAIYRLRVEDYYKTAHMDRHDEGKLSFTMATDPFTRRGVVKLTAVTDANNAAGVVQEELASTDATWRWAEGVWSDYRGWPRTVEHHEQRCVYGGSGSYPQAIWASVTASEDGDYDDFDESVGDAADAWTYVLPGMNPIQWMKSADYLMIGTTAGVGRLGMQDKPIDPTWAPIYRMQARNGCAYIDAVSAVDATLYVERGGQKVREVSYTYAENRFIAPDMTILAEHVTGPGLVEIAFAERPDPILWAVRSDGVMACFTYERKQDVLAWSRHITGQDTNDLTSFDEFESVAVIPGSGSRANGDTRTDDEVWVAVKRTVDGTDYRFVEQFQPLDWGDDPDYCWFVDCGLDNGDNGGLAVPTETEYTWGASIDPNVWWGLEDGSLTTNLAGSDNTLTNNGVSSSSSYANRSWTGTGTTSGEFNGTSDYMVIANADQSNDFPFKDGGTTTTGLFTMWFKADTGPAVGEDMTLMAKDEKLRIYIYNNSGTYYIRFQQFYEKYDGSRLWYTHPYGADAPMCEVTLGAWTHVSVQFWESCPTVTVLVGDDDAIKGTFTGGGNDAYGTTLNSSEPVYIGYDPNGGSRFDGVIDDVLAFDVGSLSSVAIVALQEEIWAGPTGGVQTEVDLNDLEGADPLIGESLCVYADGRPIGQYTVDANGVLDLGAEYDVVIAGLNYYSILETVPLVSPESMGRPAVIEDVTVDFYETMGAHVGATMAYSADWRFSEDDFATAIAPYTGFKGPAGFLRGSTREPVVYIWEWDCIPMTIRAIMADLEVTIE